MGAAADPNYDHLLKIAVLSAGGSGATSLLRRYVDDAFDDEPRQDSIGVLDTATSVFSHRPISIHTRDDRRAS